MIESVRALRGLELAAARTGSSFVIAGEIRGPLSVATLQQAGTRIQRRYPGLRARCISDPHRGSKIQIEFCATNRQQLHIEEFRSDADLPMIDAPLWRRVIQHYANQRFDPRLGFMFRIGWVPCRNEGGHVVVSVAQVVIDEASLLRLFRELLEECGKLAQFPALQRYDPNALDAQEFPPALLDVSLPSLRAYLAMTARRTFRSKAPMLWPRFARSEQPAVGIQRDAVSQSQFATGASDNCRLVLQMSQRKQIALSYIVGAAVEFALGCDLRPVLMRPAPHATPLFPIVVDVDLRPTITSHDYHDQLGMLQGSIHLTLPNFKELTFWKLAESLQAAGGQQIKNGAAKHAHIYFEEAVRARQEGDLPLVRQVHERVEVPRIRIGCASAHSLPSRYGPLSLNGVYVARSYDAWLDPIELWLNVLDQRFHYSARFIETPFWRLMGADFLKRVWELVENCHSSYFVHTSFAEYASSALPLVPLACNPQPAR